MDEPAAELTQAGFGILNRDGIRIAFLASEHAGLLPDAILEMETLAGQAVHIVAPSNERADGACVVVA
jgi:hypothetical protein